MENQGFVRSVMRMTPSLPAPLPQGGRGESSPSIIALAPAGGEGGPLLALFSRSGPGEEAGAATRAGGGQAVFVSCLSVAVLVLALAAGRAQSVAFEPEALTKQRSALYLKATHTPLADLESEVDHLAVLSETCRVEYGAKACGLPDKRLESDKVEEHYAYYVKQPVEARVSGHGVQVDKRNWEESGSTEPAAQ